MIKMSSGKFLIVILIPINILISFLSLYFYELLSKTGSELFRPNSMILLLVFFINSIVLIQTIIRIRRNKKEKLEIEIKRGKVLLVVAIVFAISSVVVLNFSYILNSYILFSLAILLILLVINVVITLRMLSGVSNSYIFYNGRQILIEDIESYDVGLKYIYVRTSNTLLFINVFEILSIPIENKDIGKFELIMSKHCKSIIE